jgi:2-polyprenyl-3-methyl-5-hydroxy-6-metoxy-1,4-benzoquinol methylase
MFVENVPEAVELNNLYIKNDYYALPPDSELRIIIENKRRVKSIKDIVKTGSVLDIGCAKGLFLDEMKKSGYNTYGIEMSEQNAEICKANNHSVFHGDLDSYHISNYLKLKFDIISCLDVIEHVPNPNDFLHKIKDLLNNEGLLILSTPNFSGLVSKLLGNRDPFLIPPEHLNFFTKSGLKELIKANGFEVIRVNTFGFITDDGLTRTVTKYLPASLHPLSFLIKPLINYAVRSLNIINNGLELEFYLRRS